MSNQFTREDRIELHGQRDRLKQIVDIKWSTLSEHAELNVRTITSRKVRSDIQIGSSGNYDDLCGPWIYPKNPLYNQYVDPPHPSLCIWKYFTKEDIIYLKEYQENKNVIRSFFANKSLNKMARKDQTVLTNVLWEFFKFTRYLCIPN
ncbi:uncharacterized protein LOC143422386 [Xylocopa sonorina]|uniref:uncharacterized protein LOC143422386 n=1 Tax=Xylocopa sonorina TaxID=1818115 RepID=UPI00403AB359